MEGGCAFREFDVELIEIDVVTAPLDGLAIDGEDDAGDVFHRAGGAMVAGDPLRGGEGDGTAGDGDVDFGVEYFPRGFGEIGSDLNGLLLGKRKRCDEKKR